MKSKFSFVKIIVSMVIILLTTASMTMPAYAWKVKTHVYSANLILDEIKKNNGYVEIVPYGKFQVVQEYRTALETYPEYYRAGAMGPDLIPDILVGQTKIHPGTKVFSSGEIIEILWDAVKNLPDNPSAPKGDPAGQYLRINNKQQARAFVLGCMGHASGDYFGHSYINNWSGGSWPDLLNGISPSELAIITRHNVIEAYIDSKIPNQYKTAAYNTIKIPQWFVFDNMVASGTVNMKVLANDSREASSFGVKADVPAHLKVFFGIRSKLRERIVAIDSNMSGNAGSIISSVLTLEFAQKAYMKAWIEDIDRGLGDWVAVNEKAAQQMVGDGGMSKYKEELVKWSDKHLLKMLGAPDVAVEIKNKIGNVAGFVEGLLPDDLKAQISAMKLNFINVIFKWAFNMDLNKLASLEAAPVNSLKRADLFPEGSLAKLDGQMGNFNTCTNAIDETFVPFGNTLTMMKLTLIGDTGLTELRRIAGSGDTYKLPLGVNTITEFIKSLDVGYFWMENTQLWDFLFWQGAEDKNKISRVIFNLNGTTSRPTFSNMSQGPITITPGPRPSGSVADITISFSNAPDQVNAVIGLYPAGNFNANAESWQYTGGKNSGEYRATVPFKGGKYQFRIYDNSNHLLSVSNIIEVVERQIDTSRSYFEGMPTEKLAPNQRISFYFMNHLKKKGFYGLYKVGETDPQKVILSKHTLNGIAVSINVSTSAPGVPGRYQYRAYDENLVLFAKSSIIEVAGTTETANTTDTTGATTLTLKAASGAGYIKLDWNSITDTKGVSGYYLYKSTTRGGQSAMPETDFCITGTSYTDTKLQEGKTYYYILKPVYKDKSIGQASNEVLATPGIEYGDIVLTLGDPYMKVNGVSREIDPGIGTVPETMDGRTCLPIRAVAEEMGSKVGWDNVKKKVTMTQGNITVELWIGKKTVQVNGKEQSIDVAPYTSKTGRTMIPLRFAGESLGGVITWDNETKTANIVYTQLNASKDQTNQ